MMLDTRTRFIKVPLYARHGIVEAWLLDVTAGRLHVYRNPRDGEYADVAIVHRPTALPLSAVADVTVDLSGMLV